MPITVEQQATIDRANADIAACERWADECDAAIITSADAFTNADTRAEAKAAYEAGEALALEAEQWRARARRTRDQLAFFMTTVTL